MSLHHDRLRAQHGHPLHRDHTEDLETGIASAVREIDEMRAALDRVRALTYASDDGTEWEHIHPPEEGEPECPACWAAGIRHAIEGDHR